MAPYRGVRYHLKEKQRQANQKPENAKELFNLRHSSLRNVIERIFGVLKRQWQILGGKGCEYSIETQVDLFCALVYITLESNVERRRRLGKIVGLIYQVLKKNLPVEMETLQQELRQ
jgi:hypothetical protein